jgi:selenide,water dikinase
VKRILLIGAGHAHAVVLRSLAKNPLYGARITLVSPLATQLYSAMLPGLIAGHYARGEAELDIARLAERAYVEFVPGAVEEFDAAARSVKLQDGRQLGFDIASLNAGSSVDLSVPGSRHHALHVKPFERFIDGLEIAERIAIAGAGAAGAELAMALRYAGAAVTLYSDQSSFPVPLEKRVSAALRRAQVDFRPGMPVTAVENGPTVIAGSARQSFDLLIWATGAAPLPWLRSSRLALGEKGFVQVDQALRSVSHAEVFAVGDCAALHPKSGVHSVRQGALLAQNLRHLVRDENLQSYQPNPRALMLLSCGTRYAIAQRGDWTAEGRWVWRWKDWIDRRWLRSFAAASV